MKALLPSVLPNFVRDQRAEFAWKSQAVREGLLFPELVNAIYRACHRVHFVLGPGFLHQVYRRATMIELRRSGLPYEYVKQLPIEYEAQLLGYQEARLILVDEKILLAAFALHTTDEAMAQQLKARMRRLKVNLGLLANFYGAKPHITPVRVG